MALQLLSVFPILLFASAAKACLLPPHGCLKAACDNYGDMIIPPNNGDWSKPGTWSGKSQFLKLAFIRSSFNKLIAGIGPSPFNASSWLDLLKGYNGYGGGGPPYLPSVNYEFYDLGGATVSKEATDKVTYGGVTYTPSASLSSCCHACRVTEGCPLYAFVPLGKENEATSVSGGKCYFIYGGADGRDGPFDFTDGKSKYSPRKHNLTAPAALSREATATKLKNPAANFPTYYQLFLGGYCNPWKYSNGTVTDDPHFTGAHGTRFDFNGELNKAFCLMTDSKLVLNALLKGYKSDNPFGATEEKDGKALRSWIKELGLVWADDQGNKHTLHLVARDGKVMARGSGFLASADLDGIPLAIPQEDGASVKAADLTFTFLGTTKKGWYDLDKFQVLIGKRLDLSFHMRAAHPKLQAPNDAEVHFNLMINDVKVTDKVHGVLGQTYRSSKDQVMKAVKYQELNKLMGGPVKADGKSGAGFLEGSVQDYEASHILKPDCKVSSYEG